MELKFKQGSITDATEYYILHQVNCQGMMGSGVAKAIRDKWPGVLDEYTMHLTQATHWAARESSSLLGEVCPYRVEDHCILNAFGQIYYGKHLKRYTDYEAVYQYLENTRNIILSETQNLQKLALPYKMASDRGGADWDVILAMIKSVFKDTDITITIYQYECS